MPPGISHRPIQQLELNRIILLEEQGRFGEASGLIMEIVKQLLAGIAQNCVWRLGYELYLGTV
jgi:hypothetical protein